MLSLVAPIQHPSRRLDSVSCLAIGSAILLVVATHAVAQRPQTSISTCRRVETVDTIRQQILVSKTLDDPLQRITLLIRTADLLWPLDNERARAAFTEAFDIATESEQTKLSKSANNLMVLFEFTDQRYVVIRARRTRSHVQTSPLMIRL